MYRASFLIDKRGMHVLYYSLFLPYTAVLCIVLKYGVTHTQQAVNVYLYYRKEL